MDKSAAFAASAGARANVTGLDSFLTAFPKEHLIDTHEEKMYGFAWGHLPNASLESYLLQNWFTGRPAYDAVFINNISNSTQVGLIHVQKSCHTYCCSCYCASLISCLLVLLFDPFFSVSSPFCSQFTLVYVTAAALVPPWTALCTTDHQPKVALRKPIVCFSCIKTYSLPCWGDCCTSSQHSLARLCHAHPLVPTV